MKPRSSGERKDIKPITGMFELLKEEGQATKKERGSVCTTYEHTQKNHTSLSSLDPEANCALVPSWEEPLSEHLTPEDYVTRRKRRNKLSPNDPVVCVCTG